MRFPRCLHEATDLRATGNRKWDKNGRREKIIERRILSFFLSCSRRTMAEGCRASFSSYIISRSISFFPLFHTNCTIFDLSILSLCFISQETLLCFQNCWIVREILHQVVFLYFVYFFGLKSFIYEGNFLMEQASRARFLKVNKHVYIKIGS